MSNKEKGTILVLGGGIAGVETALELSSLGYGVYLVERSDHLGGMIPDLHRIYPICSCCKLDPKVYACQQDPNIKVFLNTEIKSVDGKIGNFKISLKTPQGNSDINVAGIVLASGFEPFDPSAYENYAYSHPNVITSLEYEQIQKPLGVSNGIIQRPSDGKVPQRIAWLQCVGSRDINRCDAPYCSSVCCMYALKEALNTKETNPDIDTTIFYMDMRAQGKGFEEYMNNALDKGVNLVRCRIHTIEPKDDVVSLRFADDTGEPHEEKFDLVVLSVGLRPSKNAVELAKKLGLELAEGNFIKSDPLFPGKTNIPGVFVCGAISGPCDIRQSLCQAGSVASYILSSIEPEAFTSPVVYPEIRNIENEEPKIIFAYTICENVEENEIEKYIEETIKAEPLIIKSIKINEDMKDKIVNIFKDTNANRLIFASCSPIVHKNVIQEALRISGLNPYMYELLDLRSVNTLDQIRDRIRLAVTRISMDTPTSVMKVPVIKHALVVGGGISGLETAFSIANQGYPVTLIEKTDRLGGHGRYIKETWEGSDVNLYLQKLISALEANDKVNIMTNSVIKKSIGTDGNFITTIIQDGREIEIRHGVTIIAIGGEPIKVDEYMYGKSDKVLLWSELMQKIASDSGYFKGVNSVAFIQCVGSRDDKRPYCSNICCSFSIKAALELKEQNPNMDIYIINRDIRATGFNELLYREARKKGVIFIRYELTRKPIVRNGDDGRLDIIVFDPVLQREILIKADLLSLQTAIEAVGSKDIADMFGVSLNNNGFFAESPEKMRPVDTTKEGIFIAGIADYPKDIMECIAQARAASVRAVSILKQDFLLKGGLVAEVDPGKCAVCCTCVRTCPFGIPYIDHERGAAFIDPLLCKGCGICVSECPGKAIKMSYCSDDMLVQVPAMLLQQIA